MWKELRAISLSKGCAIGYGKASLARGLFVCGLRYPQPLNAVIAEFVC